MQDNKRELGKYYTINSPFELEPFMDWFGLIPDDKKARMLEPFAGACNIPLFFTGYAFDCFDIAPPQDTNGYNVVVRDCIKDYPKGYGVAITNPPYLGKSSAARRHIGYPYPEYTDLYMKCLEVMLGNTDYVAAIIPDSFITSGLFVNRLDTVISLTFSLFCDTDCPVCLALFSPLQTDDFKYYVMDEPCGMFSELKEKETPESKDYKWIFNDPDGDIGVICIDNTQGPSIRFVNGSEIGRDTIKHSSRSITRVGSGVPTESLDEFLALANEELARFRNDTHDIFLTSFKGLRKDGRYRRRITFEQVRNILNFIMGKISGC